MFLAMQVLRIPAGGRGFPLVNINKLISLWDKNSDLKVWDFLNGKSLII